MQLFLLKKVSKQGQCKAMRCTERHLPDQVVTSTLWGLGPGVVQLCVKHSAIAEDWAAKNGFSGQPSVASEPSTEIVVALQETAEGGRLVGFSEPDKVSGWLLRVYEIVQELAQQEKDGKAVVEVCKTVSVEGHADLAQVSICAQEIKAQLKVVLALEKEATAPLATALSRIRDLCRPAKQVWADAEHLLRAHLEAAALRQEARNRAAQAEVAVLVAQGADPTAAIAKMTHITDLQGVSLRLRWRAVVKDVMLLPEAYVVRLPYEKKLKEHCATAQGAEPPSPIPGVEFVRDVDSRIQAAKA